MQGAYNVIPTQGTFTVYTMSGRKEGLGEQLCPQLHHIRNDYLRQRNPQISVVSLDNDDPMWVDFARLVYAPNVLIPSTGSSWVLWSVLANNGTVKLVPPLGRNMDISVFPPNMELLTNATLLYPPQTDPLSASLLGVNHSSLFTTTPQGMESVFQCYREC